MSSDRNFGAAEAWCETVMRSMESMARLARKQGEEALLDGLQGTFAHATLVRDCVRAMAALASGRVQIGKLQTGREWAAWLPAKPARASYAPDPLTAMLAALDAQEAGQ